MVLTKLAVLLATSLADCTNWRLATGLAVRDEARRQALHRAEVCLATMVAADSTCEGGEGGQPGPRSQSGHPLCSPAWGQGLSPLHPGWGSQPLPGSSSPWSGQFHGWILRTASSVASVEISRSCAGCWGQALQGLDPSGSPHTRALCQSLSVPGIRAPGPLLPLLTGLGQRRPVGTCAQHTHAGRDLPQALAARPRPCPGHSIRLNLPRPMSAMTRLWLLISTSQQEPPPCAVPSPGTGCRPGPPGSGRPPGWRGWLWRTAWGPQGPAARPGCWGPTHPLGRQPASRGQDV